MNTITRNEQWSIHRRDCVRRTDRRPVSMTTRRHVKPECRDAFESALRAIVGFAVTFPGHLDVHVLCRTRDHYFECAIAHRFAESGVREAFTKSAEYRQWLCQLRALTEPVDADTGSLDPDRAEDTRAQALSMGPILGVTAAFGLFLGALWLPPAIYSQLTGWHPIATGVLSVILLITAFAWITLIAIHTSLAVRIRRAPSARRTIVSTTTNSQ